MCLYHDQSCLDTLLENPKKKFTFYKALEVHMSCRGTPKLVSPYRGRLYKPGHIRADTVIIPYFYRQTINHGIHVYTRFRHTFYPTVLVKVTVNREDIFGAEADEVVCKKVFLSKKEYNRAISGYKKYKKGGGIC